MTNLSAVREKLDSALKRLRENFLRAIVTSSASALEHEPWCNSHNLALCTGCSVLEGWDRNWVTSEPTTCTDGKPHEWLPKPCNCGPNDERRGDRRKAVGS